MDREKEKRAIEYLKTFQPPNDPYYLCYSGGKDSDTIRILADLAGVDYDCVHNLTTVDAPETVNYVKLVMETYGERKSYRNDDGQMVYQYGDHGFIVLPKESMWVLVERKRMPPTRMVRYCCNELKERGGKGRLRITGVRWEESPKRKDLHGIVTMVGKPKTTQKIADEHNVDYRVNHSGGLTLNNDNSETRRFVEQCYRTRTAMLNPIVDWTDDDVWEFLAHYGCTSNPLYAQGYKRIGCIGCPMGGRKAQMREFAAYPKIKQNYIKAFDRMVAARIRDGLDTDWKDGEEVMAWWIGDKKKERYRDYTEGE